MSKLKSMVQNVSFLALAFGLCFGPMLAAITVIMILGLGNNPYTIPVTIAIGAAAPIIMILTMNKLYPDEDEMEEAFRSQA